MTAVIDALRELDRGDEVRLTIGGDEYAGVVTEWFHDPAEYHDGLPIRGGLTVGLEFDDATVTHHDVEHSATVFVTERRPGEFEAPTIEVWDPVVEDGTVVEDDYRVLSEIEEVEPA